MNSGIRHLMVHLGKMRTQKISSPIVTSYRRLCQDALDGASLHQGTLRLTRPVPKGMASHRVLLKESGASTSCSMLLETEIFNMPWRNCGKFETSTVLVLKDCDRVIGGQSAGWIKSRFYSSDSGGPVPVDASLVDEDLFRDLADDILHTLQEKIEILGEDLNVDGFDSDYADGVLTLRLGRLGTYVINKQTPNRQIWLSSPVSGPGRFDWVESQKVWIYRRTKVELVSLLEEELSQLLNTSVRLR